MINPPNPGNYMQGLTNDVVALRNAFDKILNDEEYLTSIGGTAYLETVSPAGPGLSATDAAACVAAIGNLANLAAQYNGGAQAVALNYRLNSTPMWSGS